ncbi:tyrosine-type recombinase/integrase [Cohaesibacter celericrescens]|uniref:Tyr recombinase domain-containing protein n=1 Tax=Cohaesibacter celericrescens TaxID=2067669 RepID=A0A2N5XTL0_9HYPH|nr:hypothetical protein [Cohaesibacter celericrescens]PLW77866.1 hypothetical protein C0081_06995 [Cohaesibacter celericrescens]
MAKVSIKIQYVVWRSGRPRFVPGKALRALGYKGEDLKHPDGTWLDLNETISWSKKFGEKVNLRRQQITLKQTGPKKKPKNHAVKGYICVGELLVKWHTERRSENKLTGKPSLRTLRGYDYNMRAFQAFDEELWTAPAASITDVMANGIYKKLRSEKGVSMSKAIVSTLRPAWGWAKREMGLVSNNPWTALRMTTPLPRLRVGSIAEMKHLIATADKEGRPDVGDAIMLGICSGQRQNDRLLFKLEKMADGLMIFKQSKTGAIVQIPEIKPLADRLLAAKARRNRHQQTLSTLLIDEKGGCCWERGDDGDRYRKAFRKVCDKATETMPSLEGFRDQDLRDTAVTWLADAGCTLPQIASITGHSVENIHKILKHYLAQTPEQASQALKKLSSYLVKNGGL